MVEIVFLGTGGGRFVTITQRRWTGGIRLIYNNFHLHLDPGPGALVRSIDLNLDPQKVRALFVSHGHPDHYNDAEVFIEAMTRGTTKRKGVLVAPHSVLFGSGACEQSISSYHQNFLKTVYEARPGDLLEVGAVEVNVVKAVHSDPETVGYSFKFPEVGVVSYSSDTSYFEGIEDFYSGTRLLILCVLRPRGHPCRGHLTTLDAARIVGDARPEVAIITHFGMRMLMNDPEGEAKFIEKEARVPTVAAFDGMRVKVNKDTVFPNS